MCVSDVAVIISLCCVLSSARIIIIIIIITEPPVLHQAFIHLFLSTSLSLSLRSIALSSALSGRMSTIDSSGQHFSNDGSLWVVPNRIQQTGDQVSGELAGIREEEEKLQQPLLVVSLQAQGCKVVDTWQTII